MKTRKINNLPIAHWQTEPNRIWTDETTRYLGRDPISGLHFFSEDGAVGLYAKHRRPIHGHQLIRGIYYFEFCRQLTEKHAIP